MIDSIIGETDSSIWRRFASFFYGHIAIFYCRNRKTQRKRHKKSWSKSKETKERERARHLHDGDSRRNTRLGSRAQSRILRRSRIRAKMRERKQCGFFERFRQGLEGEGAGAVPEAEQAKRRRNGRVGGRGVTSSFIITQTVTVFTFRKWLRFRAWKDTAGIIGYAEAAGLQTESELSLSSFYNKNLFFKFLNAPYANETWIIKMYKNESYR